jgi:hypothetical protein
MSPWWIITEELYPMGPYATSGKAEEVKDSLDCSARVFETVSTKLSEAKQELRAKLMQTDGSHMAHKNFKGGKL